MKTHNFIVMRGPSRGRGYPRGWILKNTGTPLAWVTGPNQTCQWHKDKQTADNAAQALNKG